MLKLAFDREPFWLDLLPGVQVQFRPVSVAAILPARTAATDVLCAGSEDAMVTAGVAFTRSLAHSGIVALEGIGDVAGNPVEPTKETIDAALELRPVFDAIDRLPDIMIIHAGKFIGIEVKTDVGRLSPEQKEFERSCILMAGSAW